MMAGDSSPVSSQQGHDPQSQTECHPSDIKLTARPKENNGAALRSAGPSTTWHVYFSSAPAAGESDQAKQKAKTSWLMIYE